MGWKMIRKKEKETRGKTKIKSHSNLNGVKMIRKSSKVRKTKQIQDFLGKKRGKILITKNVESLNVK